MALVGTVHAVCARSAAISFPNFSLRAWLLETWLRLYSITRVEAGPNAEGTEVVGLMPD